MKPNSLAQKLTNIAAMQVDEAFRAKRGRVTRISKYRSLYNNEPQKQLRVRYSAPLPIFPGLIDTLQADLDDPMVLKFVDQDPADWRAVQKANAALQKEQTSVAIGAQWYDKFRQARLEAIITGRGNLKYSASSDNGYSSSLDVVTFEDLGFEPRGGGNLENHLFAGQWGIWKTKQNLLDGVKSGIYEKDWVKTLTEYTENDFKHRGVLEMDEEARFRPLGLSGTQNNWVGQPVYSLIEWVLEYEGRRWYILFDYCTRQPIRFQKLEEIHSDELFPWMSFATHKDPKNFASKSFADDLYPHAITVADAFNEEMENRRRRNSNARLYDKDMIKNVQELQEAQIGRDKLVSVDTKGGTHALQDGIYALETPELTGTIDLINWLQDDVGRNLGVTDIQQGAAQEASKQVGVAYAEQAQISKRLSFMSEPFIQVGQELCMRFFTGLKDYMKQPIAIKIVGEDGDKWDTLKRIDLNIKRPFEVSVSSQSALNQENALAKQNREKALELTAQSPNVNGRVRDEFILRDIGNYSEVEIALLLDTHAETTKDSVSLASAAVQDLMMGRVPPINYKADGWFLARILDYVQGNMDEPKIKKNYDKFMAYITQHEQIAADNAFRKGQDDAMARNKQMMMDPEMQPEPEMEVGYQAPTMPVPA